MRKFQAISNGRAGCGQGRTQHVEVKRKSAPKLPVRTQVSNKPNPKSTAISILRFTVGGSRQNAVIVNFSRLLSESEKTRILRSIEAHESSEILACKVWRADDILRLTVKQEDIGAAGRRDARVIVRQVVHNL